MSDIIHLLPESLANQIAAGEVIQRPASVVKELLENAIDAGADEIKLIIKDAGRTLIQVIDNGLGMSETDARMSFERHATSKISKSEDLFAIKTRGFRGEALASIAAIATVELKTRKESDELGVHIQIGASELKKQERVQCPVGSNFIVRDLFFNVPARRKFLKKNQTEINHIITELQRVALVNENISFSFIKNDELVYDWFKANLKQRIAQVIKKNSVQGLIPLAIDTEIVKISGFITKPEFARKTLTDQFFFVNGRFMRHPYFHKAIQIAFQNLISPDLQASYFVYFELNPSEIDVNIHPTKTEIKFSEAQAIFQILMVSTKEALGKYNIMPSIDFDQKGNWGIESPKDGQAIIMPEVEYNSNYNPFDKEPNFEEKNHHQSVNKSPQNWELLYQDFEKNVDGENGKEQVSTFSSKLYEDEAETSMTNNQSFWQLKKDYILTSVKSGLMLIHRRRGFERILFDDYLQDLEANNLSNQQLLYPEEIELSSKELKLLEHHNSILGHIGFDCSFASNRMIINGLPQGISVSEIPFLLDELFIALENGIENLSEIVNNKLANVLAKAGSYGKSKYMSELEMQDLSAKLFSSTSPNFTHDGKKIIKILSLDEIRNFFK
ncbi:MAG: DNA mismatch repair endonuclease MutL [Bacteroidales bacterium]|nr:DNA mismatch repair endonuclease MutL [Bacteroidales bacterium]